MEQGSEKGRRSARRERETGVPNKATAAALAIRAASSGEEPMGKQDAPGDSDRAERASGVAVQGAGQVSTGTAAKIAGKVESR